MSAMDVLPRLNIGTTITIAHSSEMAMVRAVPRRSAMIPEQIAPTIAPATADRHDRADFSWRISGIFQVGRQQAENWPGAEEERKGRYAQQ